MTVRESLTVHIRSEGNPADLLTKVGTGQKRHYLILFTLYYIFNGDTQQWAKILFRSSKPFHDLICSVHEYMFERTTVYYEA